MLFDVIVLVLAILFYMIPMMIAFYRNLQAEHRIFLVNVFLGWIPFVWVGCLFWAVVSDKVKEKA